MDRTVHPDQTNPKRIKTALKNADAGEVVAVAAEVPLVGDLELINDRGSEDPVQDPEAVEVGIDIEASDS